MTPETPVPRSPFSAALRHARRVVVFVIGSTVVLIGIIMLVTPGPAFVVIPIGLGILAIEFAWARRLLHRVRAHIENTVNRVAKQNRSGWFRRRQQPQQPRSGDSQ